MKKIFLILASSFLIFGKVYAEGLKNPGDIMVDFESFSQANCDYQCFEKIDESYILPDFPDTFTDKWLDENLLREGKKYFNMKQWIYEAPEKTYTFVVQAVIQVVD